MEGRFPPVPGLRYAEVDGASLIGVPTGGVCARWTAVRAIEEEADSELVKPRTGGEASDIVMSGEEVSAAVDAAKGLRANGEPKSASACAGS